MNSSAGTLRPAIYLARHGACASGGAVLGSTDPPLTDEGRRQATELAREFARLGVERIVTSGLRRARETAQLVAAELALGVETDTRLNEISYGRWDGLTWEEIERSDPETARRKLQDWWSVTPQAGESTEGFLARVRSAWRSLANRSSRRTLVVAHLAVNAVLVELAMCSGRDGGRMDWGRVSGFQQDHGSFLAVGVSAQDLQ